MQDGLRPEQDVANIPSRIAEVILELHAVVQTYNGGDRSTRKNDNLVFTTEIITCLVWWSLQASSHEYDQHTKLLRPSHL